MIDKELLSAVLGEEYIDRLVEVISIEDNLMRTYYDCGSGAPTGLGLEINIYELAHKCKEWAFNEGFTLSSSKDGIDEWCIELYNHLADDINDYRLNIDFDAFDATTEPEAIFKACQWILDNKETK